MNPRESSQQDAAPTAHGVDALVMVLDEPPKPSNWTERDLLDRLHCRYGGVSMGARQYAVMEHVRDRGSFASSTIDALVMSHYRGQHHDIDAFEVKVSRSDFRRELADDCAKSACWRAWVDHFWIVAPGGVVPLIELPAAWGLMETWRDTLRVTRPATRLTPTLNGFEVGAAIPREVVSTMLRCAQKTDATS